MFAQLLSIFYAMNESYQNSANIRQFFQVILTIFSLHLSGFIEFNDKLLQDFSGFTRFYKSLWKLMIFHKTNEIFWVK